VRDALTTTVREKHRITGGEQTIVVRVDTEPDRVGLGPYNRLPSEIPRKLQLENRLHA
jgi:hypothetical protein